MQGLQVANDSSEGADCRWAAAYPVYPGADALSAAMKADIQKRVPAFLMAADSRSRCPVGMEANIAFDTLVASGNVVGVRLTTQDYTSVNSGLSTRDYWYDGATKTGTSPLALIADAKTDTFAALLSQKLKGRPGLLVDNFSDPAQRTGLLTNLYFRRNGDLVVYFDQGTIAAPAVGVVQLVLPKAQVLPLLSDFGRRAQQQTISPSGKLDLGASSPRPPRPRPTA
ncbi:hypothetical protein ABZX77_23830 [Streptomyces sp. NPDC004237]|uniref:hypothetical protein n=1 Tax=Streptomyces sp. NPDC004237 TaxID=3154455 RepID=UPI0033B348D8